MKSPGFLKKSIVLLLVANLAVPQGVFLSQAHAQPQLVETAPPGPVAAQVESSIRPSNPLLDTLSGFDEELTLPFTPPSTGSCLDEDPFLLNHQRWVPRTEPVATEDDDEAFEFSSGADHLQLAVPAAKQNWELTEDFTALGASDKWIFIAPKTAQYFSRCGGDGKGWEGIFVVDRTEIERHSRESAPVPVFFLPLPTMSWQQAPRAIGVDEIEEVVFSDGNETVPVHLADIEAMVDAERFNLAAALGEAARASKSASGQLRPLPLATAGFGLFLSARTIESVRELPETSQPTSALAPGLIDNLGQMFLLPRAFAEEAHESPHQSDGRLASNLIRVGVVLTASFAVALVQKCTVRRKDKLGNLYAANLSVINYTPSIGFSHGLQFTIDRYLPQWGSAKNSPLRWVLNETVHWYGRATQKVPVDWRTLLFGTFILGGTESLTYCALMLWVFPYTMQHWMSGIPNAAEAGSKLHESDYIVNELPRNASSWATGGAVAFSSEMRLQAMLIVEPRIESEMRKRRLDPLDPRNEAERNRLFDLYMEEALDKLKLPKDKDFLYDFLDVWNEGMRLLGYSLPPGFIPNQPVDKYLGLIRPGAVIPATRAVTIRLKERLQQDPENPELQAAVSLADEIERDVLWLSFAIRNPAQTLGKMRSGRAPPGLKGYIDRVRRTRQHLIAITANGPLSVRLKRLPGTWLQTAGRSGATLYANEYRKAFLSVVEGDPEILAGPSASSLQWAGETDRSQSELEAIAELKSIFARDWKRVRRPHSKDSAQIENAFIARHSAQFHVLVEERMLARVRKNKADATPYVPEKRSWYTEIQQRRAIRLGEARYEKEFGVAFDAESSTFEEIRTYRKFVTEGMMKVVALSPDYTAIDGLEERVHERASEFTTAELQDPRFLTYLNNLDAKSRQDIVALLYAENAVESYVQAAVNSPTLDALSPAKPGRWQRFRQKHPGSRIGTRVVRLFESFFPAEAHHLGLRKQIYRTVPWSYDFITGWQRALRVLPTTGIATYLFNWALYDIRMSYPLFMLSMAFYWTYKGPEQWLTRVFSHQGIRPMGSVSRMLLFAVCYSLATSWGSPFILAWENPVQDFFANLGTEMNAYAGAAIDQAVGSCQTLLKKTSERFN